VVAAAAAAAAFSLQTLRKFQLEKIQKTKIVVQLFN